MAYSGTTAASSAANPPVLLARPMAHVSTTNADLFYSTAATSPATFRGGNGLWIYQSSDPTSTIVGTTTYFTDGLRLGMKNGDVIFCISATSAGAADRQMGMGMLYSTNSTAGFSVSTGTVLYSTA
jgi:hypothetical protein